MGDAAALFATQGKNTESTNKKKEFVKRTMLWDQDHVALHMLEPFDKSTFGDISDSDLYTLTKEGGTFCKYHSNLLRGRRRELGPSWNRGISDGAMPRDGHRTAG